MDVDGVDGTMEDWARSQKCRGRRFFRTNETVAAASSEEILAWRGWVL